jgi:gas vesicle protein
MSKMKTSLLLLAAGAAGAAIGTLIAPKKGSETRADLKRRAGQLTSRLTRDAKKATADVRREAKELKSEVRAARKGVMRKAATSKRSGTASKSNAAGGGGSC